MKAVHIYRLFLLRMITSSRLMWILGFIAGYTYAFSYPIFQIAQKLNITLTPFIMIFLINDHSSHTVLLSGLLFALTALDFQKELRQSLLMRSGYISYAIGYLLFILTVVLLYEVFALILSQVWILSVTSWQNNWGTGWEVLCSNDVLYKFHITFIPDPSLIENCSAFDALTLSICLECILMTILAILSSTVNTITRSVCGTLMSMVVILSDMILYNMFPVSFQKYSPVTLAMLSSFVNAEEGNGITYMYAVSYYVIALSVLIISYFLIYTLWLKKNKGGILA